MGVCLYVLQKMLYQKNVDEFEMLNEGHREIFWITAYLEVLQGDTCIEKNACVSSRTTGQMAAFTVYYRSVITSHFISFFNN